MFICMSDLMHWANFDVKVATSHSGNLASQLAKSSEPLLAHEALHTSKNKHSICFHSFIAQNIGILQVLTFIFQAFKSFPDFLICITLWHHTH